MIAKPSANPPTQHRPFGPLSTDRYWIRRAQVHRSFLDPALVAQVHPAPIDPARSTDSGMTDGLIGVDLEIRSGRIHQVQLCPSPSASPPPDPEDPPPGSSTSETSDIDWQGGQIWPCFVDLHTHLDKGHIWDRSPNPDGSFQGAMTAILADSDQNWSQDDLYARMDFGLRCSYAHGTRALRTHLDSGGDLAPKVWEVFQQLQKDWADRLELQGVCLVPDDYYLTAAGEALADRVAAAGGLLGAVLFSHPTLDPHLDRIFTLAQERGLALDFHADESNNPETRALHQVALAQQRHQFPHPITCGHCCSLALQPPDRLAEILEAVALAGLNIVSLPLCNLYLQDRTPYHTPRWRGVTALQELARAGVPVAISSDNCRDPFYGFGDHDGLEVFRESVRIAHLDRPYGDWPRSITVTTDKVMCLGETGIIQAGARA
ncbi:MAG: cytosine deaminase, partial [Prochlorothrix sp.]